MVAKIDRTGEERVNSFGSKMVIVGYRMNRDIDVYFPEYDWTFKNATYKEFKNGGIKCPYEKRTFGVGYIGEGKYKSRENGKKTKCYKVWHDMLRRCYDEKFHEKYPTYKDCKVYEEWHNFQNFAEWYYNNYYEIKGEVMCLDKDILNKGNKIYSPDTCVFVPHNINILFIKHDKDRGKYPIGVYYNKQKGKYVSRCNVCSNKRKHLGYFDNPEEAFQVYKQYKEKVIKEVIDSYEGIIPEPHYSKLKEAMYNYKVEIND